MVGLLKDLVDPQRHITENIEERLIGFYVEGYSRVLTTFREDNIQINIRLLLQFGKPFSLHNQSLYLRQLDNKFNEYQVVIVWDTTEAAKTNLDLGNRKLIVGWVPTLISRTILHHLSQIKEVRLCDYQIVSYYCSDEILIPYFILYYDIESCIIDGERPNPLCQNLKRLICAE
jgi:hypothetical protein